MLSPLPDLRSFEVDPERGFLPRLDPLARLPAAFDAWETLAQELPKYLISDQLHRAVEALPPMPVGQLVSDAEWNRAMLLLSYLGHAYVWGGAQMAAGPETEPTGVNAPGYRKGEPQARIPAALARAWFDVAEKLGRPPVLSYASYALHNWRRIDRDGPIALGNIALIQNFLGGADEEWFILVHVDIEAKAAPALNAIPLAQAAAGGDELEALEQGLGRMAEAIGQMNATMARMPERCDPYIYFHRVRPYIFGWKDQPALPSGVVYDGVDEYNGAGQKFRGETGAQSSIVPSLDTALGVSHVNDPLREYLDEMRHYMPPRHRAFIEKIEAGPLIRETVLRHRDRASLKEIYNACVDGVQLFRRTHLEYAGRYIHQQSQQSASNPTTVGTAGTPFMTYLKKHLGETGGHVIA